MSEKQNENINNKFSNDDNMNKSESSIPTIKSNFILSPYNKHKLYLNINNSNNNNFITNSVENSSKNSENISTKNSIKNSVKYSHRVSVLDIYNDPSKYFNFNENDENAKKLLNIGNRMSNIINEVDKRKSLKNSTDKSINPSSRSSVNVNDISSSSLESALEMSNNNGSLDAIEEIKNIHDELIINDLVSNQKNKRATISLVHKMVIEAQEQEKKEFTNLISKSNTQMEDNSNDNN